MYFGIGIWKNKFNKGGSFKIIIHQIIQNDINIDFPWYKITTGFKTKQPHLSLLKRLKSSSKLTEV